MAVYDTVVVDYGKVLYDMILRGKILYGKILGGTRLYGTILYDNTSNALFTGNKRVMTQSKSAFPNYDLCILSFIY